jgi:hypothetical protein
LPEFFQPTRSAKFHNQFVERSRGVRHDHDVMMQAGFMRFLSKILRQDADSFRLSPTNIAHRSVPPGPSRPYGAGAPTER